VFQAITQLVSRANAPDVAISSSVRRPRFAGPRFVTMSGQAEYPVNYGGNRHAIRCLGDPKDARKEYAALCKSFLGEVQNAKGCLRLRSLARTPVVAAPSVRVYRTKKSVMTTIVLKTLISLLVLSIVANTVIFIVWR
jgi:hypothetical protein